MRHIILTAALNFSSGRISILTWLCERNLRINSITKGFFPPKKSRDLSKANKQDVAVQNDYFSSILLTSNFGKAFTYKPDTSSSPLIG